MSKYLVIVEAKQKVKKVSAALGSNFLVMASHGHIRDLPPKGQNVDIKNNFEPTYGIIEGKEDVVKQIISRAKKSEVVYLFSDPDREGEAIAQHIRAILPEGTSSKRASTNSITTKAVKDAIDNAGDIDIDMFRSYEARRILDRLVGYKCSFLTTQATGGKSAGRVQSAALRVMADREKEIQNFVEQEYWQIEADLVTPRSDIVHAVLKKPDKMTIDCEEKAKKIVDDLTGQMAEVIHYEEKESFSKPYAPFRTSTMQATASTIFGWNQNKTMDVASSLHNSGYITYMRTDSVYIIPDVISDIRGHVENKFASDYLPAKQNYYSNKANVQGGHEAIRPTNISDTDPDVSGDEAKLYKMIWKRTVASQMSNAKYMKRNARFKCNEYELASDGTKLIFDGFRKVWTFGGSEDKEMAEVIVGEKCKISEVSSEQKFTKPPPRYTEASLTKKLEDSGIGRPSTFASIPKTLLDRNYINKIKKAFHVTDLGIKVCDFLVEADFCFINVDFTKDMEEKLDAIGNKETDKLVVLTEFWNRLKGDIDNGKAIKNAWSETGHKCPKCDSPYLKKHSKYGEFYGCSNKDCKNIANIGDDGHPVEKKAPPPAPYKCPKCKAQMIIRIGYKGEFCGCPNYSKTGCNGMRDMDGTIVESKAKKKTTKKKSYKKKKKKKTTKKKK